MESFVRYQLVFLCIVAQGWRIQVDNVSQAVQLCTGPGRVHGDKAVYLRDLTQTASDRTLLKLALLI